MDYARLVDKITADREREWIEVKHNNADPEEIGEYISAIANAALLSDRKVGYLMWGVEDETMRRVGTTFRPSAAKKGNEEIENWLSHNLSPRIDFRFHEIEIEALPMVILEIPAAQFMPIRWKGSAFIRVGSYKKRLDEHPEKERSLWAKLTRLSFEVGSAAHCVSADDVLNLIDYPRYFELSQLPLPQDRAGILHGLGAEGFITANDDGSFEISNLGAVLFAKRLSSFDQLGRKAVRVIIYKGKNRVETIREAMPDRGYATVWERLVGFINEQLPSSEQIGQALRREVRVYPEIALREIVANALIHQDFAMTGVSPMVEIFTDRIEVTNAGKPLIDPLRFIDGPPQSRNEKLAGVMRRLSICEERGSGVDKTIFQIELFQMPPPDFTVSESHTKVTLYAPRPLSKMTKAETVRACYQHACLQYVSGETMTNATLRKRAVHY